MNISRLMAVTASALAAACAANPAAQISSAGTDLRLTPNLDAPAEVREQYGQFVGSWSCQGYNRQQDGTWQASPEPATWNWYYVLDGHAVQDVWVPSPEIPGAAVGTNLRTFDPATGKWQMVWATGNQPAFDYFSASMIDGNIVMRGDIPARGQIPKHQSRITFHSIMPDSFKWKYEFSGPDDGKNWTEASRLECTRIS